MIYMCKFISSEYLRRRCKNLIWVFIFRSLKNYDVNISEAFINEWDI